MTSHEISCARRRIAALATWSHGGVAIAIAGCADAFTQPQAPPASIAASLAGLALAAVARFTRRRLLTRWALHPDLTPIPAVARERERLTSPRKRRRMMASLRRTAAHRANSPYDPAPLLSDRVELVRDELLALAEDLERAATVDAATMRDVDMLMCDGHSSPLLNPSVTADELTRILTRARFRLATATAPGHRAGSTHGGTTKAAAAQQLPLSGPAVGATDPVRPPRDSPVRLRDV